MKKVVGWTAWCILGSAVGYLIAGRTSVAIASILPACFLVGAFIGLKIAEGGE